MPSIVTPIRRLLTFSERDAKSGQLLLTSGDHDDEQRFIAPEVNVATLLSLTFNLNRKITRSLVRPTCARRETDVVLLRKIASTTCLPPVSKQDRRLLCNEDSESEDDLASLPPTPPLEAQNFDDSDSDSEDECETPCTPIDDPFADPFAEEEEDEDLFPTIHLFAEEWTWTSYSPLVPSICFVPSPPPCPIEASYSWTPRQNSRGGMQLVVPGCRVRYGDCDDDDEEDEEYEFDEEEGEVVGLVECDSPCKMSTFHIDEDDEELPEPIW